MEATDHPSAPTEIQCPAGIAGCELLAELSRLRDESGQLRQLVRTDGLTGLFNYRHFAELLDQEVERSRRSGLPLVLAMVDLDHFKRLNDRWGHETGNRVLVQVAAILREGVRRVDSVCRYGGEEFALILPGTSLPRAMQVAERLRERIQDRPLELGSEALRVTASLGLAVFPASDVEDTQALLERADAMLYQAKAEGRNRVCRVPLGPVAPAAQVTPEEKSALWE